MPADPAPSPLLSPGAVLASKYRIERVLGQGGMGAVLAARHLELGHEVAIKVVLPSALLHAETLARFAREGKAAARLTSPHVARVYDVGQLAGGLPFLVMEMVHGRDLKTILEAEGPQPLGLVATWCQQAAEVLGEAHALGIVHRDIKPANMMLSASAAGRSIIKVLDFGVSKLADDPDTRSLTQSRAAIGSPAYMAPEQLLSSKDVDGRADIWGLGVVLYELATGVMPFDAGSIHQLVADIHARPHTPPSRVNPRLPRAFDEVIDRCLAKKRDGRFGTMADLERALRPFVDAPALAISIRPPGNPRTASDDLTAPAERGRSVSGVQTEAALTTEAAPRSGGNARRVVVGALVVAAGVTLGVMTAHKVTSRATTTADTSARAVASEPVAVASGTPLPASASASAAGAASVVPSAPSGSPSSPSVPAAMTASAAKPPEKHRVAPPTKEVKKHGPAEEPTDVPSLY